MRFSVRRSWLRPPPLVDEQTRARIYQAASSPTAASLLAQREVQYMLMGERQSAFAGRGYEFAENRPYGDGDEARFINWRLLARTGELYSKRFYEERRPPVWLLLDNAASMRFGTRVRLKLAQAAQLALYHLCLAQRRALAVGGVLFGETAQWFGPAQDPASQQPFIQALCAPCLPVEEEDEGDSLIAVLRQCQVQLVPGCIIIVYSDFQSLSAHDMPVVHALAQSHSVYARHIIDVSETRLPVQGEYHFARGEEVLRCDCGDITLAKAYEEQMQQRHAEVRRWFEQAQIDYHLYQADEDLFTQN